MSSTVKDLLLRYYTKPSRMKIKNLIVNTLIIGLSAALLWHFSNIWRYGNHLIGEPNIVILSVETTGLMFILVFGVVRCIRDLKREKR